MTWGKESQDAALQLVELLLTKQRCAPEVSDAVIEHCEHQV